MLIICRAKNSGFSLIETMIAIVVGLLLVLVIFNLYIGNVQSYKAQSGTAKLQENGRFALDFLKRDIHVAGYPANEFVGEAIAGTDGGELIENQPLPASDTVTVRFKADIDCLGSSTAAMAGIANNTYFIEKDTDTGFMALKCKGNGDQAQSVADNIENMQIIYGEDKDQNGSPERYLPAPAVDMGKVMSVRIALVLKSPDKGFSASSPEPLKIFDLNITNPGDKYLYKVFTATIQVRNRGLKVPAQAT